MPQIAIIVEFQLHKGARPEFEKLICEHSQRSQNEEKGCLRFDVLELIKDNGEPDTDCIWLTEFYADADAVKEHENTERLKILGAAIAPLVAKKRLIKAAMLNG